MEATHNYTVRSWHEVAAVRHKCRFRLRLQLRLCAALKQEVFAARLGASGSPGRARGQVERAELEAESPVNSFTRGFMVSYII